LFCDCIREPLDWLNVAFGLGAGNGRCSPNFPGAPIASKDYRDEMANCFEVGTPGDDKDSSFFVMQSGAQGRALAAELKSLPFV
jgi:hypothetical protein